MGDQKVQKKTYTLIVLFSLDCLSSCPLSLPMGDYVGFETARACDNGETGQSVSRSKMPHKICEMFFISWVNIRACVEAGTDLSSD